MKKLVALILALGFLVVGGGAVYGVLFVTTSAGDSTETTLFEVPPGSSFSKISYQLQQKGIIRNARLFSLYARLTGSTTSLHIGEYKLSPSMTPGEILIVLAEGKSVVHQITFPEGYNLYEMKLALNNRWTGKGDEFLKAARDKELIKELLGRDAVSLEGYLFPDTYSLTKHTTVKELIRLMVKRFDKTYEEIVSQSSKLKMEKHDHVTFASVVEKETGAPEERPLISSVFHNRLRKKMKLQSDPTIIYGHWVKTGEYLKNIRRKHIRAPSDHNTYTVKALPVGPVSNPGRESLIAALNPVESEYIFFVSRNDGTHVFSKTLKEHNAAVREWQLNRKNRQGRSWRDLKKRK